jgi:para-aminobenzoate synthetase/4-amino-4-deoxychorismate lyase
LAVIQTGQLDEVLPCLDRVEAMVEEEGLYAAGWISYEAAPAFDPALAVRPHDGFPLVWFGLYRRPEEISLPPARGLSQFGHRAQRGRDENGTVPLRPDGDPWTPSVAQADYESAVAGLRQRIARGETYQVNYTYRLRRPWA